MKKVGTADLKAHLSEHLRDVRRGETIIVLDRREPVARIVPMLAVDAELVIRAAKGSLGDVAVPPPVRDVLVGTTITLAVDEKTVERAQAAALQQGTSLDALIREYIERLAGQAGGAAIYAGLERLWTEGAGDSGGESFRRGDAYDHVESEP